jgi:rRNA maturation RNase YbeY
MGVRFSYADRKLSLKGKNLVKQFIATIFLQEKRTPGDLNYVFCSDEFLLDINQRFLNHDYYTDIITFDLSEAPGVVSGEIYISLDRVADNARELKSSFQTETLRVLFHGALHLCGYRDKTKSEIAQMRNKEEQYLRLYETNKQRST